MIALSATIIKIVMNKMIMSGTEAFQRQGKGQAEKTMKMEKTKAVAKQNIL